MGKIEEKKRFQYQLLKLEIIEIIAVAKILGVPLTKDEEEKEPFSFEEIYEMMLLKYDELSRVQRKNLDKLLAAATKKERRRKNDKG